MAGISADGREHSTERQVETEDGDAVRSAGRLYPTASTTPPVPPSGGVAGPINVIDFEDLGVAPGGQLNPGDGVGVVTNGFNFTPGPINDAPFNELYISNAVNFWSYNGTTVGGANDDVVLSRVDGAPFQLQQFDFAGFPTNNEIAFTVENLDTAQVLNYTPDGITDGGPAGAVDFETFAVPAGFVGTQFHFAQWGPGTLQGLFALDNIVVGPPEGECQTKWSQPLNCDVGCFFSTLNSNQNAFVRYDDFVASLTGPIDQVRAWIGDSGDGSGLANISAVEINFGV